MTAERRSPIRVETQPRGIVRSDLEALVRLFGLEDEWEIVIGERNDSDSNPSGDYAAATTIEEGYHSARIAIGSGWPEDRLVQFEVLAHEVAHILLADYALGARRACDALRDPERKLMQPHLNREEELLCDRISRLVVRCLRGKHPVKER
jgi:hypothetical protein